MTIDANTQAAFFREFSDQTGHQFQQVAPGVFISFKLNDDVVSHNGDHNDTEIPKEFRESFKIEVVVQIEEAFVGFLTAMTDYGFTMREACAMAGEANGRALAKCEKFLEQHRDTCTSKKCQFTEGPLSREWNAFTDALHSEHNKVLKEWDREKAEAAAMATSWMNKQGGAAANKTDAGKGQPEAGNGRE